MLFVQRDDLKSRQKNGIIWLFFSLKLHCGFSLLLHFRYSLLFSKVCFFWVLQIQFISLNQPKNIQLYNNYLQVPMQISQSQGSNSTKLKLPDPVFYARIEFIDDGKQIAYTDCWEISVLRFLHLMFGHEGIMDISSLTKFMDLDNEHCKSLIAYFAQNPTYFFDQKDYKTQEGFLIRSKWAQFLNKCGLLDLKLEKKYEVKATCNNLLLFYKGFFPKISLKLEQIGQFTLSNAVSMQIFKQYEKALNSIYEQLSEKHKIRAEMDCYAGDDEGACLSYSANQKILVDGQHIFDWQMTQFYNISEEYELGDRIGGHSDYRYK